MNNSRINKESLKLIKKIRSIKKPKEINILLDEVVKNLEDQLFTLDLRNTQLKEENKRLNRL
jgi:hypothetical protein|tara:strand:+ start:87 stop:272 length:186 start_codon:yes stop_codon:yes gene_type:complete